jgi:hypothetical protein
MTKKIKKEGWGRFRNKKRKIKVAYHGPLILIAILAPPPLFAIFDHFCPSPGSSRGMGMGAGTQLQIEPNGRWL